MKENQNGTETSLMLAHPHHCNKCVNEKVYKVRIKCESDGFFVIRKKVSKEMEEMNTSNRNVIKMTS